MNIGIMFIKIKIFKKDKIIAVISAIGKRIIIKILRNLKIVI
jgi:predicted XRE-type DNA-binding protein